jgi:hypothetical protein
LVAAVVAVRWLFTAGPTDVVSSALTPWPLFVPPFLVLGAAAVLMGAFPSLSPQRLTAILTVGAAALLLVIPHRILSAAATYSPFDDGAAYLVQAQFMSEHRTLMAGQPMFETQPGYPYALLPLLALPGFPNRLHQLVLAMVLVIGIAAGTQALRPGPGSESHAFRRLLVAFPLLTLPYFIKNLYLNLSEWLVFLLLVAGLVLWRRGWIVVCAVCLAAIAVLRQNLLLASLLLLATVAVDAWHRGRRDAALVGSVLWLFIVMTPALHNFYYGGTFSLLARGRTLTVISDWTWRPMARLGETALKYVGYSSTTSVQGLLFAIPSVPAGTVLLALAARRMVGQSWMRGALFIAIVGSVIVPTALMGLAYYPRFELVNLAVAWAGYVFVRSATLPSLAKTL